MLKPGDIVVFPFYSDYFLIVKIHDEKTNSRYGNDDFVVVDLYSLNVPRLFRFHELSFDDLGPLYAEGRFNVYRDGKLFGSW